MLPKCPDFLQMIPGKAYAPDPRMLERMEAEVELGKARWADRFLRGGNPLPFKNLPPNYQALVLFAHGYVDPESWWRFDFGRTV